jgi:micrococcal nuclease
MRKLILLAVLVLGLGVISLGGIFYLLYQYSAQSATLGVQVTPTPAIEATDYSPNYPVTRVVDGDTIKINYAGKTETVRLIGIDTPETVDPRKPVQCFGKEASDYLKSLLSGKSVQLEFDDSQGKRDKYNRLLAYIWLGGKSINLQMISEGFAFEYTYNLPYKYQKLFKAAQKSAGSQNIGLWGKSCDYYQTKK